MRIFIASTLIFMCLILLMVMTMAGVSYHVTGYGLHPLLASLGVVFCMAAGAWGMGWLAELCGELG